MPRAFPWYFTSRSGAFSRRAMMPISASRYDGAIKRIRAASGAQISCFNAHKARHWLLHFSCSAQLPNAAMAPHERRAVSIIHHSSLATARYFEIFMRRRDAAHIKYPPQALLNLMPAQTALGHGTRKLFSFHDIYLFYISIHAMMMPCRTPLRVRSTRANVASP